MQSSQQSKPQSNPLNSLFRSIFNTGQTQTPFLHLSEPEFPVNLVHVAYYRDALQSTADHKINSHKVVELVRFKTTVRAGYKPQQRQKVVAKVETGKPGIYGYVCFERARQTRLSYNDLGTLVSNSTASIDFEKLLDSLIEDGLPVSEASTILRMKRAPEMCPNLRDEDSSLDSVSTHRSASPESVLSEWSGGVHSNGDDTVSRLSSYPSGIGVKRLEALKPTNLRLCDLAVLVSAVHDLNAIYSIFHAQRFWFAYLIMRIVEKDHDTMILQETRGSSEGNKDEVCTSEAGRWYKLRVEKTLLVVLEMARLQYNERRRKFDKRVQSAIEGRSGGR